MRRTELFTKIILAILIVLSIIAVVLQIINQETSPIETAYEIITFSVAVVALILAISQGITNARTSNDLKKIIHDLNLALESSESEVKLIKKVQKSLSEADDKENP